MKNCFQKIASLTVAGVMILSATSCSMFNGNKEVLEAATELSEQASKADFDKLLKLTDFDEEDSDVETLSMLLNMEASEDAEAFFEAVEETIVCEVKADTVKIKKDKATVDMVFTMVDYDSVLEDDFDDVDALCSAIEDSDDTVEIEYTAEFEKDGKDWLWTNPDELSELYEYRIADLGAIGTISTDQFLDAVSKIGITESDFSTYEGSTLSGWEMVYEMYSYTDVNLEYMLFEDPEDAKEAFEEMYDLIDGLNLSGDISGDYSLQKNEDTGFIILDAVNGTDEPIYGSIIWKDTLIIEVFTTAGTSGAEKDVDTVLDALGLEKP